MARKHRTRLHLEHLDSRNLPSATLVNGVLTVLGTSIEDTIELFGRGPGIVDVIAPDVPSMTRFTGVNSVQVDGLAGNDSIKFEHVQAPVTAQGGAGNDKMQYLAEFTGPISVSIQGGDGLDEIEIILKVPAQAGIANASVTIDGGAGNDKTKMQVVSESANFALTTNITDPAGNEEVFFHMDQKPTTVGSSSSANVSANLGAGIDKLISLIEAEAETFSYRLSGGGSAGMKEILSNVLLEGPTRNARIDYNFTTGNDLDKIEVKTVSEARTSLVQNQDIRTNAGNDFVKIVVDQKVPGMASSRFDVDLGAGNDEFVYEFSGVDADLTLTGVVTGGLGDDKLLMKVKARSLDRTNFQLLGGGGNDLVEFLVV